MNQEWSFASNDEFKLGEDNSNPFKVHPELNCVSSPRPSVRVLTTEIFPKISVASMQMHLLPECDLTIYPAI